MVVKLKHSLVDISHLFVPAGPAPVPSPTHFSPPRRRVPSTPPNRSRGRRRRRDITPPTPSSTRTLNCSGSSSVLDAHVHWLFPHSPFRHVLHKNSAAHLELTSAFILLLYYWVWKGGGGVPFLCLKGGGAASTVSVEGGEPDVLHSPLSSCPSCVGGPDLSGSGPVLFLPMQLFSLCTATETSCHEFYPHRNLN